MTFTGTLTHLPKSMWPYLAIRCPKHGIIFSLELEFTEEFCYWHQQPCFTRLLNQQSLSMVLFLNVVKYRQVQGITCQEYLPSSLCSGFQLQWINIVHANNLKKLIKNTGMTIDTHPSLTSEPSKPPTTLK